MRILILLVLFMALSTSAGDSDKKCYITHECSIHVVTSCNYKPTGCDKLIPINNDYRCVRLK